MFEITISYWNLNIVEPLVIATLLAIQHFCWLCAFCSCARAYLTNKLEFLCKNTEIKISSHLHSFHNRGSCATQNSAGTLNSVVSINGPSQIIDTYLRHVLLTLLWCSFSDVTYLFFCWWLKEEIGCLYRPSLGGPRVILGAWKHFHLQPNPKLGCALWDWMRHLIPHFVSHYPAVVMLTPV